MRAGSTVRITYDTDGFVGCIGVVEKVFRSGRLLIRMPDGSIKNMKPEWLVEVSD